MLVVISASSRSPLTIRAIGEIRSRVEAKFIRTIVGTIGNNNRFVNNVTSDTISRIITKPVLKNRTTLPCQFEVGRRDTADRRSTRNFTSSLGNLRFSYWLWSRLGLETWHHANSVSRLLDISISESCLFLASSFCRSSLSESSLCEREHLALFQLLVKLT